MTCGIDELAERYVRYELDRCDYLSLHDGIVTVTMPEPEKGVRHVIGNAMEFLLFMTGNSSKIFLERVFGSKSPWADFAYYSSTMHKVSFEEVELTVEAAGY